jgi:WhiB family transcriptional regulator, redox-sensing transcriptional regulator
MTATWDGAACTGRGELFFGADDERASTQAWREARAKAVCARCPFRPACLDYALEHRIEFGVWGGMSEAGRANLLHWRRRRATGARARARQAAA